MYLIFCQTKNKEEEKSKLTQFLSAESLGVGVETEENTPVLEGVLVLSPRTTSGLCVRGTNDSLDLSAINQPSHIRVSDLRGRKDVILLKSSRGLERSENFIEFCECALSPDNKATEMSTRSELEEVEAGDVDELNSGEVAECTDDTVVFGVNDERTAALPVTAVPQLTLTSAELAAGRDLENVRVGTKGSKERNSFLGLLQALSSRGNNKWDFLDFLNSVSTSKDESWESRSGKGRNNGEAALVLVDLDVPAAPDLGRSEHASTTAHVTERGLTGTVGT